MKCVAVEGCTFSFQQGAGQVQVVSQPSQKVKAEGKGVYAGQLQVQVQNYTGGSISSGGSGVASIAGSSQYVKAEGQAVLLEGDNVQIVLSGTSATGSPTTQNDVIQIEKAGQQKVEAK